MLSVWFPEYVTNILHNFGYGSQILSRISRLLFSHAIHSLLAVFSALQMLPVMKMYSCRLIISLESDWNHMVKWGEIFGFH